MISSTFILINDEEAMGADDDLKLSNEIESMMPGGFNTIQNSSGSWWASEDIGAGSGNTIGFAMDAQGDLHVTYLRTYFTGSYFIYYLVYAKRVDNEWISEDVDSSTYVIGSYSSLALDSDGKPYIAYYDDANDDLKFAKRNGTGWDKSIVESDGDSGQYPNIVLDSQERPIISYYRYHGASSIRLARWNGTGWDHSNVDAYVGFDSSLAISSDDELHISYRDIYSPYGLGYAYWNGTTWSRTLVDSGSQIGTYSSISLDSDDHPHIAYYDDANDDLKYAYYNGSIWNRSTLESSGNTGKYPSLTMDEDDHPHIIFSNVTDQKILYRYWNGTEWTREVIYDDYGHLKTSILLDSRGVPLTAQRILGAGIRLFRKTYERVNLTAPLKGTTWTKGQTYSINWTSENLINGSTVNLDLFWLDEHQTSIARGLNASLGTYNWTIPLDVRTGSNSRIRLQYGPWNYIFNFTKNFIIDQRKGWYMDAVDPAYVTHISLKLDKNDTASLGYFSDKLKFSKWEVDHWSTQTVDNDTYIWDGHEMALDSNDMPNFAYHDNTNKDLLFANWNGTDWEVRTVDSSGEVGKYCSIALDGSDQPHISYHDSTNTDLKYAVWNGRQFNVETVDTYRVGAGTSIQINSTGVPHIAYRDWNNGDLKLAIRNGTGWDIQIVDPAHSGFQPSMAIDDDDNIHISYYGYKLYYASWNGTAWDIGTADDEQYNGWHSSLALDSDGDPHIAYQDENGQGDYVNYVRWNGSAWKKEALIIGGNYAGNMGPFCSLELDSNDRPHLGFFHGNNTELMYAYKVGNTTTPSIPGNLTISEVDQEFLLEWEPPLDDGGIALLNYAIYRGNSTENLTLLTSIPADRSNYTDTSIRNKVTYFYAVSAVNSIGASNFSNSVSLKLVVPVLLVDDDNGANYDRYFQTALNSTDYKYKIWDVYDLGAVDLANLSGYEAVIWTTGDRAANTLTPSDQSNLISYLDDGGRLYLSAQDLFYDLTSNTDGAVTNTFVNDYMNITSVDNDVNYGSVQGSSGDIITDPFGTISLSVPFSNYGDEITLGSGGTSILTNPSGGNDVGVRVDNDTFRLVFTSFAFEGVQNANSTRGSEFIERALDWLMSEPGTPSPPTNFTISSASGYVHLRWDAPIDAGLSNITRYNIYRTNSTEEPTMYNWTAGSVLEFNDTSLTGGEVYHYRISAVNALGGSLPTKTLLYDQIAPIFGANTTSTSATTGETFQINVSVSDNFAVEEVVVEYWYGSGTHTIGKLEGSDPFIITMDIPTDSHDDLNYFLTASDIAGNMAIDHMMYVMVTDNDIPVLEDDITPTAGTTGDMLTFSINASDNVAIGSITAEYWFGSGTHTNVSLTGEGTYGHSISLPNNSTDPMYYFFSVADTSLQWANTTIKNVTITDNDAPYFGVDHTDNIGYTGNNHTFSIDAFDNVGIKATKLTYWYSGGLYNRSIWMGGSSPLNTTTVTFYSNLTLPLYYYFTAYDEALNSFESPVKMFIVYDDDRPVFGTDHSSTTANVGGPVTFSVSVTDNIMVNFVKAEYWYGSGLHTTTSMSGPNPYTLTVTTPPYSNATLHYQFNAIDAAGNRASTTVKDIGLVDIKRPSFGVDLTPSGGTTGDGLTFSISTIDNIEIVDVVVVYSINDAAPVNTSMSGSSSPYVYQAIMPWNITGYLDYSFGAVDSSGNWNWTGQISIDITDNDAPTFGSDITPTVGYTDDEFTFTVAALDNIGIAMAHVEFWFGTGPSFNASMGGTGPYQVTITVPFESTEALHYIFHMADEADNWAHTAQKDVPIFDNDRPMLESDLTPTSVMNGDDLTFHVTLSDNIRVSAAFVEYWFGSGVHVNRSLDLVMGQAWELDLTIPSDSIDPLHYVLHFNDSADNWNATGERTIIILDMTSPTIVADQSHTKATTGDMFQFKVEVIDNIEVADVLLMYYFGELGEGMGPGSIQMIPGPGETDFWYYNITIPYNSTARLTYWFEVNDTADNWKSNDHVNVTVVDNDDPLMVSDLSQKDATTGDPFRFNLELYDNIGTAHCSVEYWLGTMGHDIVPMVSGDNITWSYLLIVPDTDRRELHYIFHFTDAAGNKASSAVIDRNITDDDLPIFLLDGSQSEATTGDPFQFNVSGWDNVGIELMVLEYMFGNSTWTYVNLTLNGTYHLIVMIPGNPGPTLTYRFTAYDRAGNENSTSPVTLEIIDNDLPGASFFMPETLYTGGTLEYRVQVKDNVGVANVTLYYSFDGITFEVVELSLLSNFTYVLYIHLPADTTGPISSYVIIHDLGGNMARFDAGDIPLVDNVPPVVDPISNMTVYIGDLLNISISATDNIEVATYDWKGAPIPVNGTSMYWTADEIGIYDIVVQVSDGDLGIAWITFTLTVLETDHDGDGDGIPDLMEVENGLDPTNPSDGGEDMDSDGLSNLEEFQLGTHMDDRDTDMDGMPDGWEHDNGLDPMDPSADSDADSDGRTDLEEYIDNTDPNVKNEEDEPLPIAMILLILVLILAAIVIIYLVVSRRSEEEVVVKKKGAVVEEDDYLEDEDLEDLYEDEVDEEGYEDQDLYGGDEYEDEGYDEDEEDLDDRNESVDSPNLQDRYLEDIYEDEIEDYHEDDLTQLEEEDELEELEELEEFEEI